MNILFINDINKIGAQMRAIRKAKKLPIRYLHEETNLSPTAFTKCELGVSNPSIYTLVVWAQALGFDEIRIGGGSNDEQMAVDS